MSVTKPKFEEIEGAPGFACGFWDFRGSVDFGSGVVSVFADDGPDPARTWVPSAGSAYNGDLLASVSSIAFYIIDSNKAGFDGGTADYTLVGVSGPASTSIDSPIGDPGSDAGPIWDGTPSGLVYEGGVLSSTPSHTGVWFIGRVGFIAVGIKA
jgi:hypothetical protein